MFGMCVAMFCLVISFCFLFRNCDPLAMEPRNQGPHPPHPTTPALPKGAGDTRRNMSRVRPGPGRPRPIMQVSGPAPGPDSIIQMDIDGYRWAVMIEKLVFCRDSRFALCYILELK